MSLRLGIVGAGGVGGRLASLLVEAGADVTLVARGAALDAIRAHGLVVRGPDGERVCRVRAVGRAADLGDVDVVLLAVKTWQVENVATELSGVARPTAPVVTLQNGIDAGTRAAAVLGGARVATGVVEMLSRVEAPGRIVWTGDVVRLVVGAYDDGLATALDALARAFPATGVRFVLEPNRRRFDVVSWQKLLFLTPFAAVGAFASASVGTVRARPETRAMLEGAMSEIAAIGRAHGVDLPANAVDDAMRRIDALPAAATASMHRDLADGRPSELDDLVGAVLRRAEAAGLAAPIHGALFAALAPRERAARATRA